MVTLAAGWLFIWGMKPFVDQSLRVTATQETRDVCTVLYDVCNILTSGWPYTTFCVSDVIKDIYLRHRINTQALDYLA